MILSKIPFTYHWIMTHHIENWMDVLDLGCGDGEFTADLVRGKKVNIIGVELYPGSIKKAKEQKIYRKIVKADITKLPKTLPKANVVIASQVIEHLTKTNGNKFLNQIETFAKKRVIVSTPVGFVPFHQLERGQQDQNPYQKHLSGWEVNDFRKRGYRVYGQGLRVIYQSGWAKKISGNWFLVISLLSFLTSPITYFHPEWAMYMIAVKEISNGKSTKQK